MTINVTFKLEGIQGQNVRLNGDDADKPEGEWFIDPKHPRNTEQLAVIQHWCSGSYRFIDRSAIDDPSVWRKPA